MNVVQLVHLLSTAQLLSLFTSIAIPYLSALFTRHPNHLTGALTVALAGLSAFVAEAQADHWVWGVALGQWLVNWLLAGAWHSKVLKATKVEADLHAALTGPTPAAQAAA